MESYNAEKHLKELFEDFTFKDYSDKLTNVNQLLALTKLLETDYMTSKKHVIVLYARNDFLKSLIRNVTNDKPDSQILLMYKNSYYHYNFHTSTQEELKRKINVFLTESENICCSVCYSNQQTRLICTCNVEMCDKCIFQHFVKHQNSKCPMCNTNIPLENVVSFRQSFITT